ncbi:hypothetical protein ACKXGF_14470 (plasmid) [Alkalibacillus sp. S2W]|uniref:hypothetical protein n=1 Tax=Alkalibacillus sp. S2W TaxID=3386553 RepID=UPI00398D5F81
MSNPKKIFVSLLTVMFLFANFSSVTFAKESNESSDQAIEPLAITYEVEKPIADKGMVTNREIGEMIERYEEGEKWLTIANAVLFVGPAAPAGIVNSVVTALGSDVSELREAYRSGQDMYWVSLYASGEKPSLTKEARMAYSAAPIIYQYNGQ